MLKCPVCPWNDRSLSFSPSCTLLTISQSASLLSWTFACPVALGLVQLLFLVESSDPHCRLMDLSPSEASCFAGPV
ncbi:hypothetical protein BDV32DRAFT_133014 [Aspergillus pseudonomiae]|nr:hypothetical protein BDV32DRAFT_133014 [Aspergillus pseudonomiae]